MRYVLLIVLPTCGALAGLATGLYAGLLGGQWVACKILQRLRVISE